MRLDGNQIQWGRNEEPTRLLALYVEAERFADSRWLDARALIDSGVGSASDPEAEEAAVIAAEEYFETSPPDDWFGYRTSVASIKARLDLMGFTAPACRHEIVSTIRYIEESDDAIGIYSYTKSGSELVATMSADQILDRALVAWIEGQKARLGNPVDKYCVSILDNFLESGMDPRVLLAVQLEAAEPDGEIVLDLYDLHLAGYFENVDDITGLAVEEMAVQVGSVGAVIVFTEGATDAEFLARALTLTAPAVSHHFRFLDFSTRVEGGADQVVRTLRSFAAAGVMNRVIGVLDNDVAGRRAVQQLAEGKLPASVKYFLLPEVDYAQEYPTLGPGGSDRQNVNGRAASIEFQFGMSNLNASNGEPISVRWTGFDAKLRDYQGMLTDKARVQENIREFLKSAGSRHPEDAEAWNAMGSLVDRLLVAARPQAFPGQEFTVNRQ